MSTKQFAAGANHRFQFQKRRQLFIRTGNETLSVVAMCVNNPDCSPLLESNELDRPAMSSMARHEN
jgi:hypothetical protein